MSDLHAQSQNEAPTTTTSGTASGWQALPTGDGWWRWNAWGPRGTETGTTDEQQSAVADAARAFERLKKP